MMEDRRKVKNVSNVRYKVIDRLIKNSCKLKKEEWLNMKCQEMEQLEKIDSRLMAEKIREITGKHRNERSTVIKDSDGSILTERSSVLRRWNTMLVTFTETTIGSKSRCTTL